MKNTIYILILLLNFNNQVFSQQTPGENQNKAISLVGGVAHLGNGKIINNSIIIFENGTIKACVDANISKIPLKGEIINIKGQHVYPGFYSNKYITWLS